MECFSTRTATMSLRCKCHTLVTCVCCFGKTQLQSGVASAACASHAALTTVFTIALAKQRSSSEGCTRTQQMHTSRQCSKVQCAALHCAMSMSDDEARAMLWRRTCMTVMFRNLPCSRADPARSNSFCSAVACAQTSPCQHGLQASNDTNSHANQFDCCCSTEVIVGPFER